MDGSLKDGNGNITTQSAVLKDAKYDFTSLFGDSKNTSPDQLLAAAHGGCFALTHSLILGEAGFTADSWKLLPLSQWMQTSWNKGLSLDAKSKNTKYWQR